MKKKPSKRKSENMLVAVQDQAIRMNYSWTQVKKNSSSVLSRMCKKAGRTIAYIVLECSRMTQANHK